ncbi:MAG: hypothetical protein U0L20_09475 [Ruminococcus sp.]|nr:hypothetical protein [Ruminococcus sp.]
MAIQNFLSGGYYGKLGATVGQRWKNKRTIRTYVIPKNPRTPTQQANRGKFANAVAFAQMGLQMNYYCTLFEDPNFTKWNYRMKTARELKDAGLFDLDLIPLYPSSFTPPTLLTTFTLSKIEGEKHISFSAPDLNSETDRVLSIMFALYNEKDVFLGYKLYLGYYYAANPQTVEVDVDDISEINEHCFVRIVSNDDENSVTDLIGSPKLQISNGLTDIHTFDKSIVDIETSSEDITVIFNEPWVEGALYNQISFDLECISSGKRITIKAENLNLIKNGGKCSVVVPFVSNDNSEIPAFASNCGIRNLTVNYIGDTWNVTINRASENYEEYQPERDIEFAPVFNSSDTGDIRFRIKFNGAITSRTEQFVMNCSGRLMEGGDVVQTFDIKTVNGYLVFTCTGSLKQYPMMDEGDYIKLTALSVICEGVTYNISAQKINLRNAIRTSYYLDKLQWSFTRDGGGDAGYGLEFLSIGAYVEGGKQPDVEELNKPAFSYIENVVGSNNCVPSESYAEYIQDVDSMYLYFEDSYSGVAYCDQVKKTDTVKLATIPTITINGIKYTFSDSWIKQHFKKTLSGWEM